MLKDCMQESKVLLSYLSLPKPTKQTNKQAKTQRSPLYETASQKGNVTQLPVPFALGMTDALGKP